MQLQWSRGGRRQPLKRVAPLLGGLRSGPRRTPWLRRCGLRGIHRPAASHPRCGSTRRFPPTLLAALPREVVRGGGGAGVRAAPARTRDLRSTAPGNAASGTGATSGHRQQAVHRTAVGGRRGAAPVSPLSYVDPVRRRAPRARLVIYSEGPHVHAALPLGAVPSAVPAGEPGRAGGDGDSTAHYGAGSASRASSAAAPGAELSTAGGVEGAGASQQHAADAAHAGGHRGSASRCGPDAHACDSGPGGGCSTGGRGPSCTAGHAGIAGGVAFPERRVLPAPGTSAGLGFVGLAPPVGAIASAALTTGHGASLDSLMLAPPGGSAAPAAQSRAPAQESHRGGLPPEALRSRLDRWRSERRQAAARHAEAAAAKAVPAGAAFPAYTAGPSAFCGCPEPGTSVQVGACCPERFPKAQQQGVLRWLHEPGSAAPGPRRRGRARRWRR